MEYSKLIIGGMYSGKTEELKRLIKRNELAGKKCQVFKPIIDNRYSNDQILTHDIAKFLNSTADLNIRKLFSKLLGSKAISVKNSDEILSLLDEDVEVVGIDEVQFFDDKIVELVEKLNKKNIRVIMSGLDMYANGDSFDIISKLVCKSKYLTKLHAVCIDCGGEAMYSYKIEDKAGNTDATIDIGSEGKYIALCEGCKERRQNMNV